jgi:hypothetical protein
LISFITELHIFVGDLALTFVDQERLELAYLVGWLPALTVHEDHCGPRNIFR